MPDYAHPTFHDRDTLIPMAVHPFRITNPHGGPPEEPRQHCGYCGHSEPLSNDWRHVCKGSKAAARTAMEGLEAIRRRNETPFPCIDCGLDQYRGRMHECLPKKPDANAVKLAQQQGHELAKTLAAAGYRLQPIEGES